MAAGKILDDIKAAQEGLEASVDCSFLEFAHTRAMIAIAKALVLLAEEVHAMRQAVHDEYVKVVVDQVETWWVKEVSS